jgi:axial budding pattern protein 2
MNVNKKMLIHLTLLLTFNIINVIAYPYIGFPFNEQLPDIARIGENYKFIINSQTFKSDDSSQIQYKAFQLPEWLNFDSSSLEFSGIPTNNVNAGTFSFILQGTDNQGSLNQTCSILLSNQPSPQLNPDNAITQQLQSIGYTNGYGGIILKPQDSFKISFNKNTFEIPSSSSNKNLLYYGKSANRTSLPNWCFFDESSLTFSGIAPFINSLDAPSLQFDLTLIATDYEGFSAVNSDFRIVVGGHSLYIQNSTNYENSIMTSPGESFEINLPINEIYLDNNVIQSEQIKEVVNYNGPSWVTILNNSKLSGTVPSDQTSNVVVNVTLFDIYGDSVFMNFDINVLHNIFNVDSISNITANDGTFFQYQIPDSYFQNETATDLTVTFQDDWLTFYHSNNTFVGQVPDDFDYVSIKLDASMNNMKQSMNFFIVGKPLTISSSSYSRTISMSSSSLITNSASFTNSQSDLIITSTISSSSITSSLSSVPTITDSPSPISTNNKSSNSDSQKKLAIGLGVAIPLIVIIAVAIFIFFFCCGKRRKNNSKDNEKGELSNGPNDDAPYLMNKSNTSNTTLGMDTTSARILAEKNLSNLEKGYSDDSSYYSMSQQTLTSESNNNLYQAANQQMSTDQLLNHEQNKSIVTGGIFNSWRKSSNGNLKTRDSLNSLATVATSDLLTVSVVNDDKIRKSQMILPSLSKLRNMRNSSDSLLFSSQSNKTNSKEFNNNLQPLRENELNDIPREESYESISSEAQLVGFENTGSYSKNIQREQTSYHAELYNINDDENDTDSFDRL